MDADWSPRLAEAATIERRECGGCQMSSGPGSAVIVAFLLLAMQLILRRRRRHINER